MKILPKSMHLFIIKKHFAIFGFNLNVVIIHELTQTCKPHLSYTLTRKSLFILTLDIDDIWVWEISFKIHLTAIRLDKIMHQTKLRNRNYSKFTHLTIGCHFIPPKIPEAHKNHKHTRAAEWQLF